MRKIKKRKNEKQRKKREINVFYLSRFLYMLKPNRMIVII